MATINPNKSHISVVVTPQRADKINTIYKFEFFFGNEPIFNPKVLPNKYVTAYDDEDYLVDFFEKAFKEYHKSSRFDFIDPDLFIIVYPSMAPGMVIPSYYEILFVIDDYCMHHKKNMENYSYSGNGPGLYIDVSKDEFQKFVGELKRETEAIIKKGK